MTYVCSSVAREKKKKKKFILPIDEKSGRYSLVSEQFALWTIGIDLIEFSFFKI
jgi:hypothetical protein